MDDEIGHRHGKRGVGTGLDGDELVREAGRAIEQQADVDDFGAVGLGFDEVLCDTLLVLDGIGAPHDDVIGCVEVLRVGRHVLVEVAEIEERGVERTVVQAVCLDRVSGAPQSDETG